MIFGLGELDIGLQISLLKSSDDISWNLVGHLMLTKDVMIQSVMIWFILRYTAFHNLHNAIFVIYISDISFMQELSIVEDWRKRIHA